MGPKVCSMPLSGPGATRTRRAIGGKSGIVNRGEGVSDQTTESRPVGNEPPGSGYCPSAKPSGAGIIPRAGEFGTVIAVRGVVTGSAAGRRHQTGGNGPCSLTDD